MVWNEEQCTLFTNKVGREIAKEEMQGIVETLMEKGLSLIHIFGQGLYCFTHRNKTITKVFSAMTSNQYKLPLIAKAFGVIS